MRDQHLLRSRDFGCSKKKHLLKGGLETAKYVNVQSFSGCLDHLVTQQNNCLDLQALEGNSHRKVNSN